MSLFQVPRLVLILLLAALAWFLSVPPAAAARTEYRAIWVDVFHKGLKSQAQCDEMLRAVRAAGYNTIIVQMRKACDAYYHSGVEPKNSAVQDGFDPLAYLLRQAHDTSGGKQRLEVHAWLVAYRCRLPGDNTWKNPRHVFQRHPEWLSRRADGSLVDSGSSPGRYYLDPGHPAVIDYTLEVVRDLLSRYDVDGIHFDYIRYPEGKGISPWGYNPTAVERFNRLTGRKGKPENHDPEWCAFRRRQISDLMRKVYAHVKAWRPHVKVSAATIVWGSPDRGFERSDAYASVFQDWPGMAAEGWLDVMFPMNYKRESRPEQAKDYRSWARFLGQVARQTGRHGVNSSDGEELNTLEGIIAQLNATRALPGIAGIATYCYAQTRKGWSDRGVDTQFFAAIRDKVFGRDRAAIPEARWLTRPTEGLIKGIATRGKTRLDGSLVRLDDGRVTHTDGTGFYAFARVKPGRHTVTLLDREGKALAQQTVEVTAGRVAEAPLAAR